MSWFQKIFTQGNTQPSQSADELKRQDFTGVLQAIVEETVMASAQWLVGVINQSLVNRAIAPENTADNTTEEVPTNTVTTTVEELLIKISTVVEQINARSQTMGAMEERISIVEQSITEQSNSATLSESASPGTSNLEQETVDVAELLKQMALLVETTQQTDQKLSTLEDRVSYLEKLLARYSIVPKIIEQQGRAIAALQSQLATFDRSGNNSYENTSQKFESFENNNHKMQPESITN